MKHLTQEEFLGEYDITLTFSNYKKIFKFINNLLMENNNITQFLGKPILNINESDPVRNIITEIANSYSSQIEFGLYKIPKVLNYVASRFINDNYTIETFLNGEQPSETKGNTEFSYKFYTDIDLSNYNSDDKTSYEERVRTILRNINNLVADIKLEAEKWTELYFRYIKGIEFSLNALNNPIENENVNNFVNMVNEHGPLYLISEANPNRMEIPESDVYYLKDTSNSSKYWYFYNTPNYNSYASDNYDYFKKDNYLNHLNIFNLHLMYHFLKKHLPLRTYSSASINTSVFKDNNNDSYTNINSYFYYDTPNIESDNEFDNYLQQNFSLLLPYTNTPYTSTNNDQQMINLLYDNEAKAYDSEKIREYINDTTSIELPENLILENFDTEQINSKLTPENLEKYKKLYSKETFDLIYLPSFMHITRYSSSRFNGYYSTNPDSRLLSGGSYYIRDNVNGYRILIDKPSITQDIDLLYRKYKNFGVNNGDILKLDDYSKNFNVYHLATNGISQELSYTDENTTAYKSYFYTIVRGIIDDLYFEFYRTERDALLGSHNLTTDENKNRYGRQLYNPITVSEKYKFVRDLKNPKKIIKYFKDKRLIMERFRDRHTHFLIYHYIKKYIENVGYLNQNTNYYYRFNDHIYTFGLDPFVVYTIYDHMKYLVKALRLYLEDNNIENLSLLENFDPISANTVFIDNNLSLDTLTITNDIVNNDVNNTINVLTKGGLPGVSNFLEHARKIHYDSISLLNSLKSDQFSRDMIYSTTLGSKLSNNYHTIFEGLLSPNINLTLDDTLIEELETNELDNIISGDFEAGFENEEVNRAWKTLMKIIKLNIVMYKGYKINNEREPDIKEYLPLDNSHSLFISEFPEILSNFEDSSLRSYLEKTIVLRDIAERVRYFRSYMFEFTTNAFVNSFKSPIHRNYDTVLYLNKKFIHQPHVATEKIGLYINDERNITSLIRDSVIYDKMAFPVDEMGLYANKPCVLGGIFNPFEYIYSCLMPCITSMSNKYSMFNQDDNFNYISIEKINLYYGDEFLNKLKEFMSNDPIYSNQYSSEEMDGFINKIKAKRAKLVLGKGNYPDEVIEEW